MAKRSSERSHPSSKKLEEKMARFVEGEVDEMKKTVTRVVRRHGGKDKFPSPEKEDETDDDPSTKVKGVHFWLDIKNRFLEKGSCFSRISLS